MAHGACDKCGCAYEEYGCTRYLCRRVAGGIWEDPVFWVPMYFTMSLLSLVIF